MPGIAGPGWGVAPVAIRTWAARTRSPVARRMVWASSSTARLLTIVDAGPVERRRVGGLQARDLLVLVGDQRRPVERRRMQRPAVAGRLLEIVGEARGVDQELLRHAAADDAGAADPILLGDHHARAVPGRDARRAHAARARRRSRTGRRRAPPRVAAPAGVAPPHRSWPFFFISARNRFRTSSDSLFDHTSVRARPWSITAGSSVTNFLPTGDLVEGDHLLHFRLA